MYSRILQFLRNFGVTEPLLGYLTNIILISIIIIFCLVGRYATNILINKLLSKYIKNNRFKFDNMLLKRKVFKRLSHLVPAIILNMFAGEFVKYQEIIERIVYIYIIVIIIAALDGFLNAINDYYNTLKISKHKPIKGFLQVSKIIIFAIGGIIIVANLMGESPLIILSGIGALAAVLMLVFKDSLLGLVAGIQISVNDMVRIGDWIEMPKYNADGDVIDISLNTIKVENFDRTITTIPAYALVSDSFRNWRGMQESGGRRIKRSIYIDVTSVKFCDDKMLEKFKKIKYIYEYINSKEKEIDEYNEKKSIDSSVMVNGRRLTNIGTFRVYIENFLQNNNKIHKDMICMVRQMPPGEHGVQLEIYAFTNDTNWINYENIQADIFDHIFAVAKEFDLRMFQEPTGYDMREGLRK